MAAARPGRLQTSPVIVGIDSDGKVVISSTETAYEVRNLRRHPTPTLCVFTDNFFDPWIRIDSSTEIVPLPDAMDGLIDYYRRISGEHPDWDDYRRHGGTATCAHPAVNRPRRVAANSSPASLMTLCGPGRPVAHAVIGGALVERGLNRSVQRVSTLRLHEAQT